MWAMESPLSSSPPKIFPLTRKLGVELRWLSGYLLCVRNLDRCSRHWELWAYFFIATHSRADVHASSLGPRSTAHRRSSCSYSLSSYRWWSDALGGVPFGELFTGAIKASTYRPGKRRGPEVCVDNWELMSSSLFSRNAPVRHMDDTPTSTWMRRVITLIL